MHYRYAAHHTEKATDLYELRQGWLDDTDIHASAFESVEQRLNVSLYPGNSELHRADPTEPAQHNEEPNSEAECFVFLASHLNAAQAEANRAGYNLAYQWLALDPDKSAAAEAALSLYPEADPTPLLKLYEEQETLRPRLMRLFRKQMRTLPQALLHGAASDEAASNELKIEALNYAATHPDIGLDLFRSHYLPLLSGSTQFEASIIEAALWGGLVRGDPDATQALSAALAHPNLSEALIPLLRLAALTGHAEFLPLLLQAAETDPDTGYPLLVLYGQKSVMPELLKALETAHTLAQAAAAFRQLTAHILPRVPRLSVVGEETEDADAEESSEQIPDIKAAHAWWQQNQPNWKPDERWLYGKPATPAHLTELTKKHAGRFGRDLMALLALAQKAPLNIPWEIWRVRQTQLLDTAEKVKEKANTNPAASKQAGQLSPQPASARHA